jgi:deoxyribonuclease (pyrimidine dimer)
MTRINCGIPVANLSGKHLLAEHREIKRVPNAIRNGKFNMKNQPVEFKLGTGHVKFFYDKLMYLKNRYEALYEECRRRDFDVTYFGDAWKGIELKYMNDYTPTQHDIDIVQERLDERNREIKKKIKKIRSYEKGKS